MVAAISIYACDDAQKAATARLLLISQGFADANITVEKTNVCNYDATTYDGGTAEAVFGKIVVIGKK